MSNWKTKRHRKRERHDAVSMVLAALLLISCAYIYSMTQDAKVTNGGSHYAVQR
jgi:hypothetical protein